MGVDAKERLGALVSTHAPSRGLMRGWPASMGAAAVAAVFVLGFAYWGLTVDDGPDLRILGGAAVMAVLGFGMFKSAMNGMRSGVWIFERGMVVQTPKEKVLFAYDDIDAWTVRAVPGIRKRYEADFGNVIALGVRVGEVSVDIPDQLESFEAIHDALREHAPVEAAVVRVPTRIP
jgi:hypothetical protein